MYNRLDTIPACDGRTDRHLAFLPRHSPRHAYASRGKNDTTQSRSYYGMEGE